MAEIKDLQEIKNTIQTLENMLKEIRHIIGYRRTLLKNADKKLQEFQDTMYAMIMEEDYPRKKNYPVPENDDGNPSD
jgi:uncharacterized coiled-coil protein SlyX